MDYLDSLTDEQRYAVISGAPDVWVSACPGSGKTRTLVAKLRHYHEQRPDDPIVAVTFTRKAAGEIKQRLGDSVRNALIDTFHGHCLRMCREHHEILGWRPNIMPMPEDEAQELWAEVCGFLGRKGSQYSWRALERARQHGDFVDCRFQDTLHEYEHRQRHSNVMDFATMIDLGTRVAELLHDDKADGADGLVLIDEAQDTDPRQYAWLGALRPRQAFIVGDPDQSIYGWRGARPVLFQSYGEDCERHHLTGTFRFGSKIANFAMRVLANGNPIASCHQTQDLGADAWGPWDDGEEEARAIAENVHYFTSTIPDERIAVLYRTHAVGDGIAKALTHVGVEFHQVKPAVHPYELPEIQQYIAWLRLCENPWDERAFRTVVAQRDPGLAERCIAGARDRECQPGTVLRELDPDTLHGINQEYTGVQPWVVGDAFQSFDTPREFLEWYAMRHMEEAPEPEGCRVTLCTAHAAKGREWDRVIVAGVDEGVWPGRGDEAEDRRLLYVAITRARLAVMLSYAMRRALPWGERETGPSRFLRPILEGTR